MGDQFETVKSHGEKLAQQKNELQSHPSENKTDLLQTSDQPR